jgi:Ni/Fe-hydrogenase 1 B-type cytochrome subunit
MIKRVYVWEFPVRLVHFFNFWCVGALSATGYYIGSPFIDAVYEHEFIMAKIRFAHFVGAYVFTAIFMIRVYWLFAGNPYAHWKEFIPFTRRQWRNIFETALFYAFLKKGAPQAIGHTGLAALAYLILFILFLTEIFTGFALYSQNRAGEIWRLAGGWLLLFYGAGTIRLVHHMIMWLAVAFVIIHFYIAWYDDIREKTGAKSSIFSGYKSIDEE